MDEDIGDRWSQRSPKSMKNSRGLNLRMPRLSLHKDQDYFSITFTKIRAALVDLKLLSLKIARMTGVRMVSWFIQRLLLTASQRKTSRVSSKRLKIT